MRACGIIICAAPSLSLEDSTVWLRAPQNEPKERAQNNTSPYRQKEPNLDRSHKVKFLASVNSHHNLSDELSSLERRVPTLCAVCWLDGLQATAVTNSTCATWDQNEHGIRLETTQ